jgi:hypothetical protein
VTNGVCRIAVVAIGTFAGPLLLGPLFDAGHLSATTLTVCHGHRVLLRDRYGREEEPVPA